MNYRIKNWLTFQHYKDRNPPWIKLHFEMLSSADWVMLSDSERVLAIACMLIASKKEGVIDGSERGLAYLERVAYLNSPPYLKPLIDSGFLVLQADASACKQEQAKDTQETETETEEETETEKNDDDARASEDDFAVPRSGIEAGIPSSVVPIASLDDPTDKQREELTYLAESTGVSLDAMLASMPHATWTKAAARLAIDRYRQIQRERRSAPTKPPPKRRKPAEQALRELGLDPASGGAS